MKHILMLIRTLTLGLFFTACAVLAHAQSPVPSKVAIINSSAFLDEKGGITKVLEGVKKLNDEFKADEASLRTMSQRMQALEKEISDLRNLASRDRNLVDQKTAQAKVDEANSLERDFNRKTEDTKTRYSRRQQEILGPIQQNILKSLQEFATEKGYTLIFDLAKDQAGLLIAIGDQSADVTKPFIAYFNAKP